MIDKRDANKIDNKTLIEETTLVVSIAVEAHATQYNKHSKRALKRVSEYAWEMAQMSDYTDQLKAQRIYSARGLYKKLLKVAKQRHKENMV